MKKGDASVLSLLIIADDFTGALDTGVQFAQAGARVRVVTNISYDYKALNEDIRVLVMDAETRHLKPDEAYERTYRITKDAVDNHVPYIYKKTDSALRGNIGSELTAVLEASGINELPFLPSFPQMGRVTRDGIHYIDGVPVAESVFGTDPFEPVKFSYIPDIIAEQSGVEVHVEKEGSKSETEFSSASITVYDSENYNELEALGRKLFRENKLSVMAGCAGFASVLPDILGLGGGKKGEISLSSPLLVVSGSLNPITAEQIRHAHERGFIRICLEPAQKLSPKYWESEEGSEFLESRLRDCINLYDCIIDSGGDTGTSEYGRDMGIDSEEIRKTVTLSIGTMFKELIDKGFAGTALVIGGDTIRGIMNKMGMHEIEPVCELAPGTVLSVFRYKNESKNIISKSGGFGSPELLEKISEIVNKKEETEYVKAV